MTTAPSRAQHATRLLTLYRRTLSPVLAASGLGHCRYLPTCSEFAAVAVARHGWLRGSALALARLARCHPWARGGLDPVPPVIQAPVPAIIQAPVPPAPPQAPSSVPRPPAHVASHRHHLP